MQGHRDMLRANKAASESPKTDAVSETLPIVNLAKVRFEMDSQGCPCLPLLAVT